MPKYYYTAKQSKTGQTMGGSLDVKNKEALARKMRQDGYILTSVKEEKATQQVQLKKGSFMNLFNRIPLKEKMVFARNLSVMIESGLPLTQAIDALSEQSKNKRFCSILVEIKVSIHAGNTLADSLAQHDGVFNDLFVNMVRVGELGGNLEEVLNIVATQLEKEQALISKVRGAMIYPSVIVVAMIGVAIVMLTYILPQILGVFEDMDVELPWMTQLIIDVSNALRNHAFLVGGVFLALGFGGYSFLKTSAGKRALSFFVLRIPVIKNIVIKVNCARFARIYSSLLKSGVGVVEALHIISKTLSNVYYQDALLEGEVQIQKGVELSAMVRNHPDIFPVLVKQMFQVGEQTGKSEEVLLKLAAFYEEEVDQITKNLSSIIEPVLMLVIGVGVGFFAVAMLQPMYSVLGNI